MIPSLRTKYKYDQNYPTSFSSLHMVNDDNLDPVNSKESLDFKKLAHKTMYGSVTILASIVKLLVIVPSVFISMYGSESVKMLFSMGDAIYDGAVKTKKDRDTTSSHIDHSPEKENLEKFFSLLAQMPEFLAKPLSVFTLSHFIVLTLIRDDLENSMLAFDELYYNDKNPNLDQENYKNDSDMDHL